MVIIIGIVGGYTIDVNVLRDGRRIYSIGGPPHHISRALEVFNGDLAIVSPIGGDLDIWRLGYPGRGIYRFLEVFFDKENLRFINVYSGDRRTQYVSGGGYSLTPINTIDFLERLSPSEVIVSPVLDEVPIKLLEILSKHYPLSIDIQGYVRRVGEGGIIEGVKPPKKIYEIEYNVFKFSSEEFEYIDIHRIKSRYILMTDGLNGAYLRFGDSEYHIPSYRVYNVDETGAGDIYLYIFIKSLRKGFNALDSSIYASAYTSYILEGGGISPIERYRELRGKVGESNILS